MISSNSFLMSFMRPIMGQRATNKKSESAVLRIPGGVWALGLVSLFVDRLGKGIRGAPAPFIASAICASFALLCWLQRERWTLSRR
jgi:hypothetical protein